MEGDIDENKPDNVEGNPPENETDEVGDSVLLTTKKNIGIQPSFIQFDIDIITCINSALNILTQLGVGPTEGMMITSSSETWGQIFGENRKRLNMAKSYIALKTKLIFDPPTTSAVLESYKEMVREIECRLNYEVDPEGTFECWREVTMLCIIIPII